MQSQRLPTRVSSACERCRRQKQRCDDFRPCSNCVNAKRECVRATNPPPPSRSLHVASESVPPRSDHRNERPQKRARSSTSHPTPRQQNGSKLDRLGDGERQDIGAERDGFGLQSPGRTERSVSGSTSSPWLSDSLRREESIVTEFGNSHSTIDITRRVLQSRATPQSTVRATFAIPGGDFQARRDSLQGFHSISDLIGLELPPKSTTDTLLNVYFFTVHWFSLVVHEPTFRQRYEHISSSGLARSMDRPFLLLLLMVLVMSCHYGRSVVDGELQQVVDLTDLRTHYLKVVRQNFMDLLDEDSIEFVQICTLLGSYWLYWGKPRSSFTILGAAVRSAQAISLHRQANGNHLRGHRQNVEECKRVWWTIYTWDRFATIVYGRPLGINDRDCDVPMPIEFSEHLVDLETSEAAEIELAPYQTHLNRIYRIASPLLENIYSIRCSAGASPADMADTVKQIDVSMQLWCDELPTHLDLDKYSDISSRSTLREKMHQLQSLSLRLTYLNLMIIIHRPLLVDWQRRRNDDPFFGSRRASEDLTTGAAKSMYETSFEQCLKAALGISRLGQSKSNLIRLAGKTHLLSFLAMNVFTSSVVLFICAMSDALSNAAQEAKRGMSRNLRLLKSVPTAGSLSNQCSMIVEDLIQMILEKEKEQMLLGPMGWEEGSNLVAEPHQISLDQHNGVFLGQGSHGEPYTAADGQNQASGGPARAAPERYADNVGTSLERTMERLHQVLKRPHPQSELPAQQHGVDDQSRAAQPLDTAWPNVTPWDSGHFIGNDPYAADMNQFWLWDMEPNMEF